MTQSPVVRYTSGHILLIEEEELLCRTFSAFFSPWDIFPGPQLFWRVIISGVNAAESFEASEALAYVDS